MTYVSTDDVFTLLRQDPTPETEPVAALLLQGLESDVAAYLRRPLGLADYTEDYVHNERGDLFLRATPVVSLAAVTFLPLQPWDPYFGSPDYTGPLTYPVLPPWRRWGLVDMAPGRYTVAYRGGIDNASIRSFITRKAAEHLQPLLRSHTDIPLGVTSVTVEGTAFVFDKPGNLDPSEFEPLERFRRKSIRG